MQLHGQVSGERRILPCSGGEEMEESGAECQEVGPVARVFHKHQFPSYAEHSGNLLKESNAGFVTS